MPSTTYSEIPDIVFEMFNYEPSTGFFFWKERPKSHFPSERGWRIFNSQRSGKRAEAEHIKGYYRLWVNGKSYLAHRVAIKMRDGACPVESQVDHVNGVKTDNRACNLRIATPSQQMRNICKASNNTSGVTGVRWDKSRGKWSAAIKLNGHTHNLGRFTDFDDAVKARKEAEEAFFFHQNHGRENPSLTMEPPALPDRRRS